ncbi:MAG: helix-turn-helix transcriptional regulator [Verrucomicrobiae bacterium]|nr:helix-turn-helix transcriptional regulator [Verrucomicrobiae bacterium]
MKTNDYLRPRFDLSEKRPLFVQPYVQKSRVPSPVFDMHYELEMGLVLEGRIRRQHGTSRRIFGPGEMWFCGMWEAHGYAITQAPFRALVFVIWPPLLMGSRFAESPEINLMQPFLIPPERRAKPDHRHRRSLLERGERMFRNLQTSPRVAPHPVRLRLQAFDFLLTAIEFVQGHPLPAAPEADLTGIRPALDLALGARRLVTQKAAAQVCRMSRDRFIDQFQKMMGLSFAQFALRHRIREAARALVDGDTPVKAVANDWGFTDVSHLHRLFLKHYGCTPSAYRTRSRQSSSGTDN